MYIYLYVYNILLSLKEDSTSKKDCGFKRIGVNTLNVMDNLKGKRFLLLKSNLVIFIRKS